MVKTNALSKSRWAQMGLGGRGRDADTTRASRTVSEDVPAKNIQKNTSHQFEERRGRLPERPSTSAGPTSKSSFSRSRRRNAEKRETKDDLYFNPLAAHGKTTTFYNFPLPGSLPTPDDTPESSPPLREKSPVVRPSTPDSLKAAVAKMNVPHGEIGMALGSPAHPPALWQQRGAVGSPIHVPTSRFQSPVDSPVHPPSTLAQSSMTRNSSPDRPYSSAGRGSPPPPIFTKQKASKWKILGGLFGGGNKKREKSTFYQLQQDVPVQPQTTTIIEATPVVTEKRGRLGRTKSTKKAAKPRPDMSRSTTEPAPLQFDFQTQDRGRTATPEIRLEPPELPVAEGPSNGSGMLDVNIPSIHMERYSIMFGSVLQNKPATANSSALLARRQATLDKLKTVNAELEQKEAELNERAKLLKPRRATSPQPTKSPAFSLFPSTNTPRNATTPSPRPSLTLQRSNTAPGALSPSRPSFAPSSQNVAHKMLISSAGPSSMSEIAKRGPTPDSGSEWPKSRKWETNQSTLNLDSPDSLDSNEEERLDVLSPTGIPMKPKLAEPSWQMVSKPTSTKAAHVPNSSISGSTTSDSAISTSTASSGGSAPNSASSPKSVKNPHIALQKISTNAPAKQPRSMTNSPVVNSPKSESSSKLHKSRPRAQTHSPQIDSPKSRTSTASPQLRVSSPRSSTATRVRAFTVSTSPISQPRKSPSPHPPQTRNNTSSPIGTTRPALSSTHSRSATSTTTIKTIIKASPSTSPQPGPSHTYSKSHSQLQTHSSKPSITSLTSGGEEDEDEHEARLKSLADVSIARQISVSRKQRQLLFIKTSSGKKPVISEKDIKSSPISGGGSAGGGLTPTPPLRQNIGVGQMASPLGAVATAAKEEIARGEGEVIPEKLESGMSGRLVEGKLPITPTIVLVGGDREGKEKDWTGVGGTSSLAERRRGKEIGEIVVGLDVKGHSSSKKIAEGGGAGNGLKVVDVGGLQANRKSERVVVEGVKESS